MENQVFAQDDVFGAAEPTIRVLLAAPAEPLPDGVRNAVLDLLFHLVVAAATARWLRPLAGSHIGSGRRLVLVPDRRGQAFGFVAGCDEGFEPGRYVR